MTTVMGTLHIDSSCIDPKISRWRGGGVPRKSLIGRDLESVDFMLSNFTKCTLKKF